MANQWDLLGKAVVEGAAEEQVVEEEEAVVQVAGEGASVVQVDLGVVDLANLEAGVEVHYEDQQGVIVIIFIVATVIWIICRIIRAQCGRTFHFYQKIVKFTYLVLEYLFHR